jgi:hypothetical protein
MSAHLASLQAQLHRVLLSQHDFREAQEYLRVVCPPNSEVIARALLVSAVVAYCRPFTPNERTKDAKATPYLPVKPSKVFVAEERALHAKLLELRNQALAHTQYSRKPIARIEGSFRGFSYHNVAFSILNQSIDCNLFDRMCGHLDGVCFQMSMELNQKIVDVECG